MAGVLPRRKTKEMENQEEKELNNTYPKVVDVYITMDNGYESRVFKKADDEELILTPKEEAEKMVMSFVNLLPFHQVYYHIIMDNYYTLGINCSLKAVNITLQIFNNEWTKLDFWTEEINGTINYWQEVKQELEKLKTKELEKLKTK